MFQYSHVPYVVFLLFNLNCLMNKASFLSLPLFLMVSRFWVFVKLGLPNKSSLQL